MATKKLDKARAELILARVCDGRLDVDFHALRSTEVQLLSDYATCHGYRQPRNANGSRARMFYQYLQRLSRRAS